MVLTLLRAFAKTITHPYPPSGGTLFDFFIVVLHNQALVPTDQKIYNYTGSWVSKKNEVVIEAATDDVMVLLAILI